MNISNELTPKLPNFADYQCQSPLANSLTNQFIALDQLGLSETAEGQLVLQTRRQEFFGKYQLLLRLKQKLA